MVLALFLAFSCKVKAHENDLKVVCKELSKENPEYSDLLRINTCEFNNHLFKSIGKPDFNGRYSYSYELLKIKKTEITTIRNSDFFNEGGIELEKIINVRLKAKYDSNSKIPEIRDCMNWIDFRYYKIDEFGISITDKNQMKFNIN